MSATVTDPSLLTLLNSGKTIELKDSSGRVLGLFVPDDSGKLPPGVQSPMTDDERARRLALPDAGRTLQEILNDLQAK